MFTARFASLRPVAVLKIRFTAPSTALEMLAYCSPRSPGMPSNIFSVAISTPPLNAPASPAVSVSAPLSRASCALAPAALAYSAANPAVGPPTAETAMFGVMPPTALTTSPATRKPPVLPCSCWYIPAVRPPCSMPRALRAVSSICTFSRSRAAFFMACVLYGPTFRNRSCSSSSRLFQLFLPPSLAGRTLFFQYASFCALACSRASWLSCTSYPRAISSRAVWSLSIMLLAILANPLTAPVPALLAR